MSWIERYVKRIAVCVNRFHPRELRALNLLMLQIRLDTSGPQLVFVVAVCFVHVHVDEVVEKIVLKLTPAFESDGVPSLVTNDVGHVVLAMPLTCSSTRCHNRDLMRESAIKFRPGKDWA